jgi:chromatin structure-remodeling complex subunit RSC1/2
MGGAQVLEQVAVREYLPPDTTRLFEQDARHQVLWFSGPPIAPGALKIPAPPNHSLEYLAFLSKRKNGASVKDARPAKRFCRKVEDADAEADAEGEEEDAEGSEDDEDGEAKDDDLKGDLSRHWWAQGQSEEQVLHGLRSVIGV